jgi:iron complex outermembrane receptor protein
MGARITAVGVAIAACVIVSSASAEDVQGVEEVIVSVQKRAQSLQDVPLAVSAFSAEQIRQGNIRDLDDLAALTPGFSGNTDDSFTDALAIRGISTNDFGVGGDPSVAIFVDGVWEGRSGGAVTTFLDVAQAEVVRGPQNTLFGRNAIAGAISVTTTKPGEDFGGRVRLTVEEYDHFEGEATINVPLTDRLYFRGTAYSLSEDGYLPNLAGGGKVGKHDSTAFQAALRWAGDRVDSTLTLFYEDRKQHPSAYWSTAPLAPDGTLDPDGRILPRDRIVSDALAAGRGIDDPEVFRAVLDVTAQLGGGWTLTSITGFKTYDFRYLEDYDATTARVTDYAVDQEVDYLSQEFRINSPTDGRVVWFAGLSWYKEDVNSRVDQFYDEDDLCRTIARTEVDETDVEDGNLIWPVSTAVTGCDDPAFEVEWGEDIDPGDILAGKSEASLNFGDYQGFAVYADATWSVTDRLDLTLGARYTWDDKEFATRVFDSGGALGNNLAWAFHTAGLVRDRHDWSAFTPRFAVNFNLTDQWTLYANVAMGYKSGGYSTFGIVLPGEPDEDLLAPPGSRPKSFDSEEVLSMEAGARARLFNNRLQANLSVFNYQYDDLQLLYFDGASQLTDNVAEASGTGVELELRWMPADGWDIIFTGAWLDTEIDKVDQGFLDAGGCDACAGNELPFAPRWSTSALVTYRFPVADVAEIFITGEHSYQDKMFSGADNVALAATPSWSIFNFRVGYDSGRDWTVTAYVQNAFDEEYFERGWENADADNRFGYGYVNTLVWPSKPRTVGLTVNWEF